MFYQPPTIEVIKVDVYEELPPETLRNLVNEAKKLIEESWVK